MEKFTNRFADKISVELKLDNNRKEVIAYGSFAILHTFLSIMLVVVFSSFFGVLIEALIISFTSSILRKYSGGAHASSPGACAVIGTVLCVGQAVVVSIFLRSLWNLEHVVIYEVIGFIWSFYIVCKLAPVDSIAKRIRKQEKRNRMRKGSILILSVYLVLVSLNILQYVYSTNTNYVVYAVCICTGILWQAFTLTKAGHSFLGKIDKFYNQGLSIIRRRS